MDDIEDSVLGFDAVDVIEYFKVASRIDLFDLSGEMRSYQAPDTRDKGFAMEGTPDKVELRIGASCSLPVKEMFTGLAVHSLVALEILRPLRVLELARMKRISLAYLYVFRFYPLSSFP